MNTILSRLLLSGCAVLLLQGGAFAYDPVPQQAEDTASVNAEKVIREGCVRRDTAASSAASTGLWSTKNCDATGRDWVNTELPDAVAVTATGNAVPATAPWVLAAMGCYNGATLDLCVGSSNIAHDAAAVTAPPLLDGCYANAAAPSDVSADLDAVRGWCLRNGARAVQPTYAGILGSTGNGVAGTGTPRFVIASDNTAISVNATIVPATSGGVLSYHLVSAGSTNQQNVKASAGQLYGWHIWNAAAYTVYVKFHNTAGSPTAGAGVVKTVAVPAGGGNNLNIEPGLAFSTGIAITIVKDITDAGTTAVLASDCVVDLHYK